MGMPYAARRLDARSPRDDAWVPGDDARDAGDDAGHGPAAMPGHPMMAMMQMMQMMMQGGIAPSGRRSVGAFPSPAGRPSRMATKGSMPTSFGPHCSLTDFATQQGVAAGFGARSLCA